MTLNRCEFIGNLGRDPELRTVGDNTVANITVAVSRKWKDKNGEQKEATEWVRAVIWGKLAEVAGKYLTKGSKVYIAGHMETRKYTDKDGVEKYSTEINVGELEMLGGNRAESQSSVGDSQQSGIDDEVPF